VVLGWKGAPYLLRCLASIRDCAPKVPYEVVVSLNAPTAHLEEELCRSFPEAIVTSSTVNRGFAGGCNRGAALAQGDYVVLVNDDAEVEVEWLESLVAAADAHPQAGAVGSLILDHDRKVACAGSVVWRDGSTSQVTEDLLDDATDVFAPRRVDFCTGSSLLVRKDTWDALGGLDERFFPAYVEDLDLCFRIAALGQEIRYEPRSRIRHRLGASTGPRYGHFLWQRHLPLFAARWSAELACQEWWGPDDPGAVSRAVANADRGTPRPGSVRDPGSLKAVHFDDEHYRRAEQDVLSEFIATLEDELDRLEDDRIGLTETMGALEREHQSLREVSISREQELRDVLHERETRLVELGRQLDDARSRVDAMASSTSWKLTAPLRTVGDRIPRPSNG
jgi:GT2 family glycosyltransferase